MIKAASTIGSIVQNKVLVSQSHCGLFHIIKMIYGKGCPFKIIMITEGKGWFFKCLDEVQRDQGS